MLPPFIQNHRRGQSLIEIVVAMGMVVFFGAAFVTLVSTNYGRLEQSRDQSQATLFGQEAINIIRAAADKDFSVFASEGLYKVDPTDFSARHVTNILEGQEVIDVAPATRFERTIFVAKLNRDAAGQPTPNNAAGTVDENARFVTVRVTWSNEVRKGSATFYTVVTNWNRGGAIIFDTQEDFLGAIAPNPPTAKFHDTLAVKELYNGEVRIGQVGGLENPQNVALIPEITLRPNGASYGMVKQGDDLLVINDNELKIVSLENVSGRSFKVMTLPTSLQYRAIAADDQFVFIGTTSDAAEIQIFARPGLSSVSVPLVTWDLTNTTGNNGGDVSTLALDQQHGFLLVGTVDGFLYQVDVSALTMQSPPSSPPILRTQRIGTEGISALATDGTFAYAGTVNNVIYSLYLQSSGAPQAVAAISFNPSTAPVKALAVADDMLIVGREQHISEQELLGLKINWNLSQERALLSPYAGIELTAGVQGLTVADDRVVVTANTGDDIRIFTKTLSPVGSLNLLNVNGTCVGIAYEAGRAYAACQTTDTGAPTKLFAAEDAAGRTQYALHSTYTTPVRCIPPDETFAGWKTFAFGVSGQGYADIQLRTGGDPNDIQDNVWQPSISDDTLLHTISSLPADRCVQARALFYPSELCPLYIENIILTYE